MHGVFPRPRLESFRHGILGGRKSLIDFMNTSANRITNIGLIAYAVSTVAEKVHLETIVPSSP